MRLDVHREMEIEMFYLVSYQDGHGRSHAPSQEICFSKDEVMKLVGQCKALGRRIDILKIDNAVDVSKEFAADWVGQNLDAIKDGEVSFPLWVRQHGSLAISKALVDGMREHDAVIDAERQAAGFEVPLDPCKL